MTPEAPVYAKRIIGAPIERVFRAWTDPEELKRWHAPEPDSIVSVVSENHIGGNRSLTFIFEGKTYHIAGTYKEFNPPHKLVYNWEDPAAPNNSITTVTFTSIDNNQTEVEVSYTNPVRTGLVQQGLFMIIDNLQHYLIS